MAEAEKDGTKMAGRCGHQDKGWCTACYADYRRQRRAQGVDRAVRVGAWVTTESSAASSPGSVAEYAYDRWLAR